MLLDQAVAEGRENFLAGDRPSDSVRGEIATSWRRCFHLRVPAEDASPAFAPDFDPESPLLRAARPVLDHVNERLGDVGISLLLTDASARILDRRSSNRGLLDRLDGVSATIGHVFAEHGVGTNGIGTALELRRTVRVDGHEHYVSNLSQFTCIGVPILGVDRRVQGLLDVSCAADHDNKVVGFIAEQAAQKIEERLVGEQSIAERALLEAFLGASRRGCAAAAAVNPDTLITSPAAGQLLGGADHALVWEHVSRVLRAADARSQELGLPDGSVVLARVEPVLDGAQVAGALLELRTPPEREEPAAGTACGSRPPLPGLVGSDLAWTRACRAIEDAAEHEVVVVSGGPGVGKTTVARALHPEGDGPLLERDLSTVRLEGRSAWSERLRSDLAGPPGTIVLTHAEHLSPAATDALVSMAGDARAAGWRCLVTWCGTAAAAERIRGRRRIVELPALRRRAADIPGLARSFAAPRQLAPGVVALLLRVSWPANVRALRDAVERACTISTAPEIRVADLPTEIRSRAYRRQMTRFEHAEMDAVLAAMSEVSGNKKAAARLLGISRSTLYRKLELAGLAEA